MYIINISVYICTDKYIHKMKGYKYEHITHTNMQCSYVYHIQHMTYYTNKYAVFIYELYTYIDIPKE
jgi:hypothetical protein